jgi:hypothetical protein
MVPGKQVIHVIVAHAVPMQSALAYQASNISPYFIMGFPLHFMIIIKTSGFQFCSQTHILVFHFSENPTTYRSYYIHGNTSLVLI